MTTSQIFSLIFSIAFLAYLIAFKAYKMHRHPTYKSIVFTFRLSIAEFLMNLIITIMPDGEAKIHYCKLIFSYSGRQHKRTEGWITEKEIEEIKNNHYANNLEKK